MRILIVEDDPVLADGLTRSLRHSDFAVDSAQDGEQADHVLRAQNYDLVILDLGLPKLDGFEVLRRLRRHGATVPVLVLTARDALADRVKGLDLGADDYLTKPFDLPEFEARVRADSPRPIRRQLAAHARPAHARHQRPARDPRRRAARTLGARARCVGSADATQRARRQQGTARGTALRLGG